MPGSNPNTNPEGPGVNTNPENLVVNDKPNQGGPDVNDIIETEAPVVNDNPNQKNHQLPLVIISLAYPTYLFLILMQ